MSGLRREKQNDIQSRPVRRAVSRTGVYPALALLCILLLTVSPAAATVMDDGTAPAGDAPVSEEIREGRIVQYVEENREADHGEGMRRNTANLLRQIADLEDRGHDVTCLRAALEGGDEEEVKEAFSRIQARLTGP